jgi:hypothetical protein
MPADIVHKTVIFPDAQVGVPYEAALAYQGDATPITASSVSSGSLPPGLTLDAALPFTRITGTPTVDGLFTFKVTLTDTAGASQTGNLTIRVVTPGIDLDTNYSAATEVRIQWPLS